jgi:hypothetical protein
MSSRSLVGLLVAILSASVFQELIQGFAQSKPTGPTPAAQDTLKSELTGRLGEIRLFKSESDDIPLKNLVFMTQVSVLRRIGPRFLKTFPPRVPCLTAPQRALTSGRLSTCRA